MEKNIFNWIGSLWEEFDAPLTGFQSENADFFNRIEAAIMKDQEDLIPAINAALANAAPIFFSDGSFIAACESDCISITYDHDLKCYQVAC